MQVTVMGAGAVGCYHGGLLARAGHEVTFIGRPAHVDAINAHGLLLELLDLKTHVPAKAATDAASAGPADLILFCVKSTDTETAGRTLANNLRPDTMILSLQNGIDNAARLGAIVKRAVIPAVVYVGVEMAGPGHVRQRGPGEVVIGASAASAALARLLADAQIAVTVSDTIDQVLWRKLITNCAWNALSAVAGIPYGPLLETEGAKDVIANVVQECAAVARACGVPVPDDMLTHVLRVATVMPNQWSSTAQDLMRGKPSEIDYLNGYVVRKGAELGIPTPANQALQVMVKLAERAKTLPRR